MDLTSIINLNSQNDMTNRHNITNISVLESVREMSSRRKRFKENYVKKREENAQRLMQDILNENEDITRLLNKSIMDEFESYRSRALKEKYAKSPRSVSLFDERYKTSSPVPFQIVPPLNFKQNRIQININNAEINLNNKKPSLMAKTTAKLHKLELKRQLEHREIIEMFKQRARSANSKTLIKKQVKIIKPYTDFVQLNQPYKLRDHLNGQSLTYCQQLKLLQNKSSIIFKYFKRDGSSMHINQSINDSSKNENSIDFIEKLLKDEFENEQLTKNALKELEIIQKNNQTVINDIRMMKNKNSKSNQKLIDDDNNGSKDYVNQLIINGLLNFSLRSDATISSFIDWDQIDQLLLIESKS